MVTGLILLLVSNPLVSREIDDIAHAPKKPWWTALSMAKTTARVDEAIGVMNKGQLCNLTMNYGQITDTRLEDPGNAPTDDYYNFRYPRVKPYGSMVDDFALLFAVRENTKNGDNGNVIDGFSSNGNEDWIAKNGSLGDTHYDGSGADELLYYTDGTTHYLAHSDIEATWPVDDNDDHFWPGYFRRDPATGYVYDGEFVSDRDVYGVFTDGANVQGHSLGIEIEQMAYCYGRPYAEDFQFYEFFIHNTSSTAIDSAWFGIYQDPDCSDYGDEILIVPDGYGFDDPYTIIMQRDFSGDIGGATDANSLGRLEDMDFGVVFLETPNNLGITDFHYYTDTGPTYDEELWPIISSDPTDPDIATTKAEYFHGSDTRIDDVATITKPFDIVYIAATGPFDLAPGDTVKFTIAVVVGDTDDDFMTNCDMAITMFEKGFVGPSAPPGPNLSTVAGDNQVTLYWDNSTEQVPDPATEELDFEGYKIYRSEDGGVTWGDKVTNYKGEVIGYVPIAQFDLDNNYSGTDPVTPTNYLGDNTGLRYTFIDSTVYNGIVYSYTVTTYDRGDVDSNIPSYESAKGTSAAEKNFVKVQPAPQPLGYVPAEVVDLQHLTGPGEGEVKFEIIDPDRYLAYKAAMNHSTDPVFKISFDGFPAETFTVTDTTAGDSIIASGLEINSLTPDILVDLGMTIQVEASGEIGGISSVVDEAGTDLSVSGALDNTGSWSATVGAINSSLLDVRVNNYELRFTDTGSMAYTVGDQPTALMRVPFEVWRVKPDETQILCEYRDDDSDGDFSTNDRIYIANFPYPDSEPAIGDSLTGQDPNAFMPEQFPLQISFVPADSNGSLPVTGQKVTISCYTSYSDGSGFSSASGYDVGDQLVFSLAEAEIDDRAIKKEMDRIRVVPNPYVVTSLFEQTENVNLLKFISLPPECTITIYTLSGAKVRELHHDDGTSVADWNLTNTFNQEVAYGVYFYVVTTPDGYQQTGKMAIIR